MRQIELHEMKKIEIAILDCFDSFCREHGLSYSLAGGTLLGAVRHKGFIPWDDDIDVLMRREDYEKLQTLAASFPFPYQVNSIHTETNRKKPYPYTYTKIVDTRTLLLEKPGRLNYETGVYIDVFPLDGQPSDRVETEARYEKAKKMINRAVFTNMSHYRVKHSKSIKEKIACSLVNICRQLLPINFYLKRLDKFCSSLSIDRCDNVGCIAAGYGMRESMPKAAFFPAKRIEFEGKFYMCMNQPEVYLRHLYGDYMTLPPVEQRQKSHNNLVWWRNT